MKELPSKELKKNQRREVLQRRDSMPQALRDEKSMRICENILSSRYYAEAQHIMLFRAFRSEASLLAFEKQAAADGRILMYPFCLEDRRMLALSPEDENAWEKDAYGIDVPIPEKSKLYAPEEIDLVLCPCSAFDEEGHRLGMGAGYYDRFLPECRNARFLLVAFEEQRLSEVFTDEFDVKMHAAVTDERLMEF